MTTPLSRRKRGLRRGAALVVAPALLASGALLTGLPGAAEAATKVPNTAKLAGALAKQKLVWETCDFGTDALNTRLNRPNVACATVKVPRDWHNPGNGKTWDIRISQAKNIDVKNARYEGTIFVNPGGPGGEGLPWGPVMAERAVDLNPYYNYVGFDPRGVGQSSHASCEYSYDPTSSDPDAQPKAAAKACSSNEDVKTINTEQTAYDMDFIRSVLKAPKLSYIGYSYGTWLGAWYENLFGAKYGDRFLLDSSIDATKPTLEKTWDLQPIARDRQFRTHMINWIARHDDTYGLGTNPSKIYDRYFAATDKLDPFTVVLVWSLLGATSAFSNNASYPLAGEAVQLLIEFGEQEADATQANPAAVSEALLARAAAQGSGSAKATFEDARRQAASLAELKTVEQKAGAAKAAALTKVTMDSPFDFVRCNDGQWTQGSAYWKRQNAKQAKAAPLSASWGLLDTPVCAFWPSANLMPVADKDTFPKTIVLQGELDSQTGWEGGYAAGTKLPNTSFIAIDNEGSHGHFPYGTEAVDRPVYNLFLKDKLPKDITVAQALPLPQETKTFESWAPLNKKAKHIAPEFTDPFDEAGRPGKLSKDRSPSDLLAEADADQLLREQVRKVYGEDGVKALSR